jgi:hypothetical protein
LPGGPDYLVSGNPRMPAQSKEVWTFVRRRGGDWLLFGDPAGLSQARSAALRPRAAF